ncbi:MAG: protein-disulfide reductase DsbD family protein [Crocinitomicaceae bacterium]
MKNILLIFGFIFSLSLNAQENPVKWTATQEKEGKEDLIKVTATMDEHWHIYSMYLKEEFGPIPTTITFSENESIEFLGKIEEDKPKREKDANFDMVIDYFDGTADFKQKIKVKDETTVKVSVYYMCCNDKKCLPPKEEIIQVKLK